MVVAAYEARFGLDQPLWKQYFRYLGDLVQFDFGYSIAFFPTKAIDIIFEALPWTIGLLGLATLIAFALGTLFGALLAWPRRPRILNWLAGPVLALSAVPYYLLGLMLVFVLGFNLRLFPLGGGFTLGSIPEISFSIELLRRSHWF